MFDHLVSLVEHIRTQVTFERLHIVSNIKPYKLIHMLYIVALQLLRIPELEPTHVTLVLARHMLGDVGPYERLRSEPQVTIVTFKIPRFAVQQFMLLKAARFTKRCVTGGALEDFKLLDDACTQFRSSCIKSRATRQAILVENLLSVTSTRFDTSEFPEAALTRQVDANRNCALPLRVSHLKTAPSPLLVLLVLSKTLLIEEVSLTAGALQSGSFIVRCQVAGQVHLSRELLPTDAAPELFRRVLVKLQVQHEGALLTKSFIARGAGERLFAGVHQHVAVDLVLATEPLGTKWTRERPFPRVR